MGERESFIGYAIQAIDGKGRVALPASLRAPMEANAGARSLYLDQNETDGCLVAFDRGWIDLKRAEIARDHEAALAHGRDYDLTMALRSPIITADPVAFDASGRFVLSSFVQDSCNLKDEAFFCGVFDYVEIWNLHAALASARMPDRAKRFIEWHLNQKAAK